jgi:hypothetical protein
MQHEPEDHAPRAWYTQREVADRLGVALKTVRSWRLRDLSPHPHKFHGALRYSATEVEQFIGASRTYPDAIADCDEIRHDEFVLGTDGVEPCDAEVEVAATS